MTMTETRPRFLDNVSGEMLVPHPDNLRTDLGEWKELAGSIKEVGVLERLVVQPHPDQPNHFEILSGHRRHRGGTSLTPPATFPVEIKYDLTEAQVQTYLFVANLDREKLTPSEEAAGYFKLIGLGTKMPDLVKATGRSKTHIQTHLNLLEVPPALRRLVDVDEFSMSDALQFRNAKHVELITEWAEDVEEGEATPWRLQRFVEDRVVEQNLQEIYDKLVAGGDTIETDFSALPAGSKLVTLVKDTWNLPRMSYLTMDPKAHRKEECHLSLVTTFGGQAQRYEICTQPSNHSKAGASPTKAKPKTKSDYEKAVTATIKETNNRYLVALRLAVIEKDKTFTDIMLWGVIERLGSDDAKIAALVLGMTKDDLSESQRSNPGYGFKELILERAKYGPASLKVHAYAAEIGQRCKWSHISDDDRLVDLVKANGFVEPPAPDKKDFADG